MSKTVEIKTMDDWELVCLFCWYGDPLPVVPEKIQAEISACVWAVQDGYGVPGYTPPQGWDWSGIRDSTQEAQDRMARVIRRILYREKIATVEVMTRDRATHMSARELVT